MSGSKSTAPGCPPARSKPTVRSKSARSCSWHPRWTVSPTRRVAATGWRGAVTARSAECLDPDCQRPARCGALMAASGNGRQVFSNRLTTPYGKQTESVPHVDGIAVRIVEHERGEGLLHRVGRGAVLRPKR